MTRKVYKYEIDLNKRHQSLLLPEGAEMLSVQMQFEDSCQLWALVDPDALVEPKDFWVVPTGAEVPDASNKRYLATVQAAGGAFVFHVFDVAPGKKSAKPRKEAKP